MYFLINLQLDEMTAHKSNGAAARAALTTMGVDLVGGECPVKALFNVSDYDDRFKILTLSDALTIMDVSLSSGLDGEAREFINRIQTATDRYYQKN